LQNNQKWNTLILCLLIVTSFILGMQVNTVGVKKVWAQTFSNTNTSDSSASVTKSQLKSVQLFHNAYGLLLNNYVDPIDNADEITYAAIRGMVVPLNDPYTRFLDPKEYADFNNDTEGHFEGIGATLVTDIAPAVLEAQGKGLTCPICGTDVSDLSAYRVLVVNTIKGSPAEKAGLLPGDHITKIDDKPTLGMTTTDAANNIRGPIGTKVVLTIVREGIKEPFTVTVTRGTIETESVEHKMIDKSIGYLKISSFNEKTTEGVSEAIKEFNEKDAKGMVLDLRSNPGGLVYSCLEVAGMIMPPNKDIVVYLKNRNGKMEPYKKIMHSKNIFDKPFVILTNGGSASASEILTGMCKDYGLAQVVGEKTFGKAMVQEVHRLDQAKAALIITTARYYTPSGFDLNKKGLEPDIVVKLDKGTRTLSERDNQATKAIEILKKEMQQ